MNWFEKHITCNDSVFIIAEAGINHNGNFDLALELIRRAKEASADCIKFQTFKTEASESKNSTSPGYFEGRFGNMTKQEWSKSLEFTTEQFKQLKDYCAELDIAFFSTACDMIGLQILTDIGAEAIKIASADTNNDYLLKAIGKTELPIILSTGMSTEEEISRAIKVLNKNGTKQLALLQCTSQYPTPYDEINLRVINTLEKKFKIPVGLSDHSEGMHIPVAATALGAKIIEKHFTTDRNLPGVDHAASIDPVHFKKMVVQIRDIEVALGNCEKKVQNVEIENAKHMRRSLIAAKEIKAGKVLSENDITAKRPGIGMPPCLIDKIIGKKIKVNLELDDMFDYSMFEDLDA